MELEQGIVIRVKTDGTAEVTKLTDEVRKMGPAAAGANKGTQDLAGAMNLLKGKVIEASGPYSGFLAMIGKAGPWAAMTAGVIGTVAALGSFVKAGIEAQKVEADLEASIGVTGAKLKDYKSRIEDVVATTKKMSRFDDTGIKSALEQMITLTGNVDTSLKLMSATTDFAAARHMELANAAEIVARALEGNVTALRRSGVILSEQTKKVFEWANETERASIIQGILNSKFGGRAAADLQTTAGAIAKLKSDLHDMKEEIGQGLLEMLADLYHGLNDIGVGANNAILGLTGFGKKFAETTSESSARAFENARIQRLRQDSGHEASPDAQRALSLMGADIDEGLIARRHEREEKEAEARKKALEEAERVAKLYSQTMDLLHGKIEDYTTKQHAFSVALNEVAEQGIHASVNLEELEKQAGRLHQVLSYVDAAGNYGSVGGAVNLTGGKFTPTPEQTLDSSFDPIEYEKKKTDLDRQSQKEMLTTQAAFNARERQLQAEAWQKIADRFRQNVEEPLTDIFTDLAQTGGKNFGQIAGGVFNNILKDGMGKATDSLLSLLGLGGVKTDANGNYTVNGVSYGHNKDQAYAAAAQNATGGKGVVAQGALAAAGGFESGFTQRGQSDVQAGVGAALAGIGTAFAINWVVGVVVAAATYLGHLLQPSPSLDYKYGTAGVNSSGDASFIGNKNYDKNAAADIQTHIQQQYDTFFNGFNKILLTLHASTLATFAVRPVVGRFENGADLGNSASQKFEEELGRWVNTGLPRQIAEHFFRPLSDAFVHYGFSSERFQQIFGDLQKLDPKKGLDLLGELATAAVKIFDDLNYFRNSAGDAVHGGRGRGDTLFNVAGSQAHQTFTDSIADSDKDLMDLANSIKNLTGEEQIHAVTQVSQLIDQRYQKEQDYLRSLVKAIEDAQRQIDKALEKYETAGYKNADGSPDNAGLIGYYTNKYNSDYAKLQSAKTLEEAQRYFADVQGDIDKLYELGQNFDQATAESYRQFAMNSSRDLLATFNGVVQNFGDAVVAQNEAFLAQFQPIWDAFTGHVSDLADATTTTVDAASTFDASLATATTAVDAFTASLNGFSSGVNGNGSGRSSSSTTAVVIDISDPNGYVANVRSNRVAAR